MSQPVFDEGRFVRVRYDRVPASQGVSVATILIHQPQVAAFPIQALDELVQGFERLESREDVKAAVISGSRPECFVTGIDHRELLETVNERSQARALAAKAQALFSRIEAMGKPVIAAIAGPASDMGCELAMACHYRIGNRRTRMGLPAIKLFLPPGCGGSQRLPRLLEAALADTLASIPIALGWLLSGRLIAADAAKDGGLLDEVVTGSTDVLSRARLLAAQCARGTQNPVAEAMGFRGQQRAHWDEPEVVDWPEIEQDSYLLQCLAQARHAGRGKLAEAIVELVRTGLEQGIEAGLAAEAETFARFALDAEHGGKKGIRLFLEQCSPALPVRRRPQFSTEELKRLEDEYWLLPVGSPFVPGITPLPGVQYAWAVMKDPATGDPDLGEPKAKEKEIVVEIPRPAPDEALLYVLASEINSTDVGAITGLSGCVFDRHDEDEHVTGSGGVGLVVELGEAVQAEGRLQVGDVVAIYPGRWERLDPQIGADPMFTRFVRRGYDTPDGSHQQFMLVQGSQCLPLPAGIPLEAAGSFIPAASTAYRCLFNALGIEPGKRMLVEGAAAPGRWAVSLGRACGARTIGLVTTAAHAASVRALEAGVINSNTDALKGCFTPIPADPSRWAAWQMQGAAWLTALRAENDQALVDYAVCEAGGHAFARSFQALAEGGAIALHGGTYGGDHTAFLGKPGMAEPAAMLRRVGLRPGETIAIYYGIDDEENDTIGVQLLEAAHAALGRIVVITRTDAQHRFVHSLRLGSAIAGVLSIEALARTEPEFRWQEALPELPDGRPQGGQRKAAVQAFCTRTVKPLSQALGQLLQSSDNPCGLPDAIIERAGRDTLALSTLLAR
ncbi:MAG TPA: enoyl-CoA hydratase-related protein, partial [Nitrococcus sp.]|nr:enoyl-CoA hydratase-related protein [Nitrococcus sp.]